MEQNNDIRANVAAIREKMAEAARSCGRDPKEIKLCAATKMNDAARVKEAAAGVDCCGENRVQELLEKQPQGAYEGAPVHFIGHLQTNKVKQVVGRVDLIESVDRTELLDLDMVNTYFRLTERGKLVEQKEIRLVSPNFACSGIETLSLPAEVSSAFVLDWDTVIFDVGGDDVGATALGRYHQDFVDLAPGALEVLNVVNIRRPLAGTVEKLLRLQEGMQTHARLQITGMINNTNLATATTEQDLWDGYQMLREVSDLTGIPVSYTTGKKEFLDAFLARNPDPKYVGQPIPIDVYMHRDWDSYIEYGLNTKNPHKDMY